ncbi:MAG: preprotein translocase subunit SecA [Bryobacteraceae bacterium]
MMESESDTSASPSLPERLRSLVLGKIRKRALESYAALLDGIAAKRSELEAFGDDELKRFGQRLRERASVGEPTEDLRTDAFALASTVSERVLGLLPFEVQILGGLALDAGKVVEMQTGEGKTLAAVPAVYLNALAGRGVHVLTSNDYLAKRDAAWMGEIYRFLGLSAGFIAQDMEPGERRAAYACDITYATANEAGFDFLRDNLALTPDELVHRPFHFALIDEADSILIDEARIPLVIAGGSEPEALARRMDAVARTLKSHADYFVDEYARNIQLTNAGARKVERALGCRNLYEEENLPLFTAIIDALHARVLLRRNVDYVVKDGAIHLVDEFKGRIARDRRWPAGLQSALEAKEGVAIKRQGRILGSITMQSLVALYPKIAGMTGTAATQSREFREVYGLDVVVIPTNKPVIRVDHPDLVFSSRRAKEKALIEEIAAVHATGRPILAGTASVAESERLSLLLEQAGVPHHVLNARNHEAEAAVIAQAGSPGAVTISTNMAGRGTDIQLGGNPPRDREKVLALGGLYVIGTNKHESRRIDNQLRGRAGRQGDPGSARFFVSLEDDLLQRYGITQLLRHRREFYGENQVIVDPDVTRGIETVQRIVEGQNLEIRRTLWKYEGVVEKQRQVIHSMRRQVLLGDWSSLLEEEAPHRYDTILDAIGADSLNDIERRVTLGAIDELWPDYLAAVGDLRSGIHWVSFGGKDPLHTFLQEVVGLFDKLQEQIVQDVVNFFEKAEPEDGRLIFDEKQLFDRGATWTYLVNDQPFGSWGERLTQGLKRKIRERLTFSRGF